MSAQPAEQADAVVDRSALPRVPGLPWWSAVVIAVVFTAIGFAFDAGSGHKELGAVFATCYVLGCVLAVLAVRQSAVFTAVIQPPLILFVAVPGAYFMFHSAEIGGIKDILINCGYPLIERFPLMFFTAAAVLIIGMVRWYIGASNKRLWPDKPAAHVSAAAAADAPARRVARRFAQKSVTDEDTDDAADDQAPAAPPRRRPARRPNPDAAPPAARRGTRSGEPSRARHTRPPDNDIAASAAAADRRERMAARERPARSRREAEPPIDPARQPRRPRPSSREPRRPAPTPYEPADHYERPRRPKSPDAYERYGRDPRYDERPRPPAGTDHHPVSRVRYRSSDEEHRPRPTRRFDEES
ncbi:DUF6542 domain-containing protein [Mycolicibacterium canariasense]|uniref:DUF6542 domain-containing protein n=2 Tax=Mycolicibacterium canariasense TaxID=228230 RepID=UPI0007EB7C46|nr:DUF6542 domain-containing protein [Mycolicibacterium canariasense]MCV7210963.1 hypothetical protein [Mycolicibacterium canariasense]